MPLLPRPRPEVLQMLAVPQEGQGGKAQVAGGEGIVVWCEGEEEVWPVLEETGLPAVSVTTTTNPLLGKT